MYSISRHNGRIKKKKNMLDFALDYRACICCVQRTVFEKSWSYDRGVK
jgi:hypothetical protein